MTLFSCAPPARRTSSAANRAELLRLHQRARAAHLEHRADCLASEWADTLFSLSHRSVSVGTRENRARSQAGFQKYLDASTFQAWDDIAPPRIRISPDGQIAYVIVEKLVHLTAKGMMFVPRQFVIDAVPDNATPALMSSSESRRADAWHCVLNWLARNLEPSPALDAIVLANVLGFGCVALSDVWGVFSGGSRPVAKVFLVIHLLLAIAFVMAWQTRLRQPERRSAAL